MHDFHYVRKNLALKTSLKYPLISDNKSFPLMNQLSEDSSEQKSSFFTTYLGTFTTNSNTRQVVTPMKANLSKCCFYVHAYIQDVVI